MHLKYRVLQKTLLLCKHNIQALIVCNFEQQMAVLERVKGRKQGEGWIIFSLTLQ